MKKLFLVANWKSHKNTIEAKAWLQQFSNINFQESTDTEKEVVICSSFSHLPILKEELSLLHVPITVRLGAQNISAFTEGAHTGEEAASQIREFAEYVIIGHSERRKELGETDEILSRKVALAKEYQLEPIFCVQGKETFIPEGVSIVAYEPPGAIGTGQPDKPEHAEEVASYLKHEKNIEYFLYGGSVTAENVHSFTSHEHINGVLVGAESLDPLSFTEIVKNA